MKETGFAEHLDALRSALGRILLAVAVVFPFGCWYADRVLKALIRYALPESMGGLHYFTPMEAFTVELKLGLFLALAATFPWNFWQLWRFVAPGLYAHERRAVWKWLGAGTVLFLAGAGFAILGIFPMVMKFSASFGGDGLQPMLGIGGFVSLAGYMALAFGVMFQFPLLILILTRAGLVSVETLRRGRPIVLIAILVLAAVLTPPDLLSQILLAAPTYLLFEIALWIAARRPGAAIPPASADRAPDQAAAAVDGPDAAEQFYRDEQKRNASKEKKKKKKHRK